MLKGDQVPVSFHHRSSLRCPAVHDDSPPGSWLKFLPTALSSPLLALLAFLTSTPSWGYSCQTSNLGETSCLELWDHRPPLDPKPNLLHFLRPRPPSQGHLGSLPSRACPPGPRSPSATPGTLEKPPTRPLASSLAALPSDPRAEQPPGSPRHLDPTLEPAPVSTPHASFQMCRAHVGLAVGGPPNPHALLRLVVTPGQDTSHAACPATRSLQTTGRKMRICVRP